MNIFHDFSTAKYLPPEVIIALSNTDDNISTGVNGNPSWDVWSLGMIVLELILGQSLFTKYKFYFAFL